MDSLFKAFTVFENEDGSFKSEIISKSIDDLPPGDVLVRVDFSSLNYKDALSATGNKGVTKKYPHTPGIDAVGTVEDTSHSSFKIGDQVIVSGYDMGQNTAGGFGEYIRVPREWVALMPEGLTKKESIILGTAGMTAGLSLRELQKKNGIEGKLAIVTGATGGVGSVAVIVCSKLGYNVTAVTGKDSKADYLKSLGAKNVVNRSEFDKDPRLIDKGLWDGVVDTVGGKILANAIVQTNPNGIIAVCGNANTNELNTNVIPFMLRGIKLWGMDSANCSIKRREFIWNEAANLIDFNLLEASIQTVSLEELIETYPKILKGEISGRVLVDLNK